MEFSFKNHKSIKTKTYIKKNKLFFLFDGIHRNANNLVFVEQNLKNIRFNYWKVCNITTKKALKNSICRAITPVINGITFAISPGNKSAPKQAIITCFEALFFKMLAIKLNYKVYRVIQLKLSYSFQYKDSKMIIFQLRIADIKKNSK